MKAVILAGGLGTRLRPFTTVFPKPLMPIGEMPIIEIVIRQLSSYGFNEIIISTGYLSELIQTFLQDGKKYGVKIDYVREEKPLGTVGCLALLKDKLDGTFLMMNGDVISDINYFDLMEYHRKQNAKATICLNRREIKVNLGVIDLDDKCNVKNYSEKPTLNYLASMGINILEPDVQEYLNHERMDFPDLTKILMKDHKTVKGYVHKGYWLDIGRPEDYEKASEESEIIQKMINPSMDTEKVE